MNDSIITTDVRPMRQMSDIEAHHYQYRGLRAVLTNRDKFLVDVVNEACGHDIVTVSEIVYSTDDFEIYGWSIVWTGNYRALTVREWKSLMSRARQIADLMGQMVNMEYKSRYIR